MKIRYNRVLAIVMLVASTFILGTSLVVGPSMSTVSGALIFLIALGYMFRPLAELTATELTVFALIGPITKKYAAADLRLVDGKIYAGDKKVRLPSWVCHGDDWRELTQRLQARGGGA